MDPQNVDPDSSNQSQSARKQRINPKNNKKSSARGELSVTKKIYSLAKRKFEFTRGLQFTITAQIISVIAISFSIGNTLLYRTASERLLDQTYQRYNDHINIYVNSIERWEKNIRNTMHALSENPSIRSLDPEIITIALKPYFKLSPNRVWRLFDESGKLLLSSNVEEMNIHNRKIIELRLNQKDGYLNALEGQFNLGVDFIRFGTRIEGCLAAHQPILPKPSIELEVNKVRPIGVLRFCLPLSKLAADSGISGFTEFNMDNKNNFVSKKASSQLKAANHLEMHRGDYSGQIFYIVTQKGNLIFPTATAKSFDHITLLPPRKLINSTWGRITEKILGQYSPDKFKKLSLNDNNFYAISKKTSLGFSAIGIIDEQTVFNPLNKILKRLLTLQVTILLIISIVSYLACSQLTKPLRVVIEKINNLSNLDLSDESDEPSSKNWILEINQVTDSIAKLSRAMDSFTRYLPTEVVRNLLNTNRRAVLGGSNQEIAIMFTDVADFTKYSETLPAKELLKHLNDYFNELTKCVKVESGTIDKYIGDSLMVLWGAPVELAHPCQCACNAALAISAASKKLANQWKAKGIRIHFDTRIGIHYGNAIVGNVGSINRFNFTVVGDSVNYASRLEGVNKNFGSEVIVSNSVLTQLSKEGTLNKFCFKLLDAIRVKGKNEAAKVYELVDHTFHIDPQIKVQVEIWNRVMNIAIEQSSSQGLKQWEIESSAYKNEPFMQKLRQAVLATADRDGALNIL